MKTEYRQGPIEFTYKSDENYVEGLLNLLSLRS